MGSSGVLHAVVVNHEGCRSVLAFIARRPSGIYYLMPRDDTMFGFAGHNSWNPHASYHSDGTHHVKSFGDRTFAPTVRQPLSSTFVGSEPLFAESLRRGDPSRWKFAVSPQVNGEVFEIPSRRLHPQIGYSVVVDLLAAGATPGPGPWGPVVLKHVFRDAVPWVHVAIRETEADLTIGDA